jgi:hypothetical protein
LDLYGRVVASKRGRDSGRLFAVVGGAPGDMLLVSDGRLRKIGRPKKKNMRHLAFTGICLEAVRDLLVGGGAPTDKQLRGELARAVSGAAAGTSGTTGASAGFGECSGGNAGFGADSGGNAGAGTAPGSLAGYGSGGAPV